MPDQRTTDERYYQDEDGSWFMYAVDVESLVAPLRARVAVLEGTIEAARDQVERAIGMSDHVRRTLLKWLAGVGSTPNPSDEPSTSEERRLRYYLTNLRDGLTGGCLVDREWLVRYLDEVLNPVAGEGSDQDESDDGLPTDADLAEFAMCNTCCAQITRSASEWFHVDASDWDRMLCWRSGPRATPLPSRFGGAATYRPAASALAVASASRSIPAIAGGCVRVRVLRTVRSSSEHASRSHSPSSDADSRRLAPGDHCGPVPAMPARAPARHLRRRDHRGRVQAGTLPRLRAAAAEPSACCCRTGHHRGAEVSAPLRDRIAWRLVNAVLHLVGTREYRDRLADLIERGLEYREPAPKINPKFGGSGE